MKNCLGLAFNCMIFVTLWQIVEMIHFLSSKRCT